MKQVKKLVMTATSLALSLSLAVPAVAANRTQRVPLRNTAAYVSTTCDRFTDVPADHWGRDGISYVVDKGLFNGTSSTTFAPDMTMSRAMLCTVLYRFGGSPAVNGDSGYADVENGSWYADGVAWARQNRILPEAWLDMGQIAPQDGMTRSQFAVMIRGFYEYTTGNTENDAMSGLGVQFPDLPWDFEASRAMAWAYTYSIINGTSESTMSPDMEITRSQVAAMLERYDRQFGEGQVAQSETPGETSAEDAAKAAHEAEEKARFAAYAAQQEEELIRLINDYRAENGLPRLTRNEKLMEAADVRAEEVAVDFSHVRPNGEYLGILDEEFDTTHLSAHYENIAGTPSAQTAFEAWKKSPGHNSTMLTPDAVTEIGVGVTYSNGGYAVMLFGQYF